MTFAVYVNSFLCCQAMKRSLQSRGALGKLHNNSIAASSTCSKCQKVVSPVSEFHKHILDCGGDTTWMLTMFPASSTKRPKFVLFSRHDCMTCSPCKSDCNCHTVVSGNGDRTAVAEEEILLGFVVSNEISQRLR